MVIFLKSGLLLFLALEVSSQADLFAQESAGKIRWRTHFNGIRPKESALTHPSLLIHNPENAENYTWKVSPDFDGKTKTGEGVGVFTFNPITRKIRYVRQLPSDTRVFVKAVMAVGGVQFFGFYLNDSPAETDSLLWASGAYLQKTRK